MMSKQKRRDKKAISKRQKEVEKNLIEISWRNIFVKNGFLKQ